MLNGFLNAKKKKKKKMLNVFNNILHYLCYFHKLRLNYRMESSIYRPDEYTLCSYEWRHTKTLLY